MHIHHLDQWKHDHVFLNDEASAANEKRVFYVVLLTFVMMLIEISAGILFNSMALLADGWHMATHAGALGLTVFAYRYARKHANDRLFTFGVGKVEILGGYTNAILLGIVALFVAFESVDHMINPRDIAFNEAMLVAFLGLLVNIASVWLLGADHHHGHGHSHGHSHDHHHGHDHGHDHPHHHEHDLAHEDDDDHSHHNGHHHEHHHEAVAHHHHDEHTHEKAPEKAHEKAHDRNLKGAYLHVLADALTSVLAIAALLLGKLFGWTWTDALMGLVGSFLIGQWSYLLMKETGGILLDRVGNRKLPEEIRSRIENVADNRVVDLHVWYVGSAKYAAIISLVTHYPREVEHYKALISSIPELAHVTIEVHRCEGEACIEVPFQERSA
nr:cation diffusion facilitator family transporter [uncultured Cohaesibacter sp.]